MQQYLFCAVSVAGLCLSPPASGQEAPLTDTADPAPRIEEEADKDIVVTGVRQSLERAAEVKRNAVQVVDSIVATDIGKLPDPNVAAALQRVPGIQVSVDRNNELAGVRIRGLQHAGGNQRRATIVDRGTETTP